MFAKLPSRVAALKGESGHRLTRELKLPSAAALQTGRPHIMPMNLSGNHQHGVQSALRVATHVVGIRMGPETEQAHCELPLADAVDHSAEQSRSELHLL